MKLDKNLLVGIISLLLAAVIGILTAKGGIFTILLVTFLFIAAVAGAVILFSFVLPAFTGAGADWFYYLPFAVALLLSRAVFGWDLFIPFAVAGFFAVTLDIFSRRDKKAKHADIFIVTSGALASVVFMLISLCGGILL